ncbi:uncharacterized protein LOC109056270 [Cyprinus carpio]|uniref:Uncharacterized protein LOC109056270 n=1 Tax=Cyprinus carpio TaxID=7962 RepID=A0A9R0AK99_CYPCA|nr:uncharacterized protein LOC109056270 [Cyprinus carpio]
MLYRVTKDPVSKQKRFQYVLPVNLKGKTLMGVHDLAGHQGQDRTLSLNALSRQLEGLMEKQAANTVLLEDPIQRICALERKFDEQRPQEEQRPREEPLHKRIKRAHNVGIAEAVRRLHNSENNPHKYDPQTGISSPRNQAVMTYQLEELKSTFADADPECIQACCKTYFETLRRKYNLSQPEKSQLRDAIKTGAKNRQRKRRLLDSRSKVVQTDAERELWQTATVELMSDEEGCHC